MKKILIMIAMVCLVFIVGCQTYPQEEADTFCKSKGFSSSHQPDDNIHCIISNEDYKDYKLSIQIDKIVDDTIQQHEKSEDATNGEK